MIPIHGYDGGVERPKVHQLVTAVIETTPMQSSSELASAIPQTIADAAQHLLQGGVLNTKLMDLSMVWYRETLIVVMLFEVTP